MLGWELDADKADLGSSIQLLGLEVSIMQGTSCWRLGSAKRASWSAELRQALTADTLTPGQASKWAGRFAFVNAYVFNRLGRALIRPLIWRQLCIGASTRMTSRLRNSLHWFLTLLDRGLERVMPLARPVTTSPVLLYSDADGKGWDWRCHGSAAWTSTVLQRRSSAPNTKVVAKTANKHRCVRTPCCSIGSYRVAPFRTAGLINRALHRQLSSVGMRDSGLFETKGFVVDRWTLVARISSHAHSLQSGIRVYSLQSCVCAITQQCVDDGANACRGSRRLFLPRLLFRSWQLNGGT